MKFENFIKEKKVVRGQKDEQKAKALISMAKQTLSVVEMMPENEESASVILTTVYESLREMLEAITLNEGLKIYSHEAYTYYLQEKNQEAIAQEFDRLRKLRNGVNYYGKPVSLAVAKEAKKTVCKLMKKLEKIFL